MTDEDFRWALGYADREASRAWRDGFLLGVLAAIAGMAAVIFLALVASAVNQ